MKYLVALGLVACAGFASAQFYGGDPDGVNGLVSNENSNLGDFSQTFDDFTLSSSMHISALYGNFYITAGISPVNASWEIRTGMSNGNGGTLVASGTSSAAVSSANGFDAFGFTGELITVATNFDLSAGTYYMTITPDLQAAGRGFIATTSGANASGSPIGNGNSWFNSAFFGANYSPASDQLGINPVDFSYGVTGSPVPEPASMLVLGLGAIAAIRRRRASK